MPVDYVAVPLHLAIAGQHTGRQHQTALCGVAIRPEDQIGQAGLVPHQHDARPRLAVVAPPAIVTRATPVEAGAGL